MRTVSNTLNQYGNGLINAWPLFIASGNKKENLKFCIVLSIVIKTDKYKCSWIKFIRAIICKIIIFSGCVRDKNFFKSAFYSMNIKGNLLRNTLPHIDAIWRYRATIVQIRDRCQTAPHRCLGQYHPEIIDIHFNTIFQKIHYICWKIRMEIIL